MSNTTDEDETGIMHSLDGVKCLKNDKVDLYPQLPRNKKPKIQSASNEAQVFQKISYNIPLATRESWFHHGIQKKLQRKIKAGQLRIDALLDLHGHRQYESIQELESFLQYAIKSHSRMLLIIHGKGFNSQSKAVLRPLVQHWLSEQNNILAYCPAQPKDGGSGASYVYLKSSD